MSGDLMSKRARAAGFTLIDLLIVIAAAGVLAVLLIPPYLESRKIEVERAAFQALGAICRAEWDLEKHDLDGNGKSDYWVRDIRGLSRLRSRSGTPLIDDRLAQADEAYPDARVYQGHLFRMVERDEEGRLLGDASGFGSRFLVFMHPARVGEFRCAWAQDSDKGLWKIGYEGHSLTQWPRVPAALGWGLAD